MINLYKLKKNSVSYSNEYTGLDRCVVCGKKFPMVWEHTLSDNEATAAKKCKPHYHKGWNVWHGKRMAKNGLFCTLQCALDYATKSFITKYEHIQEKKDEKSAKELNNYLNSLDKTY